MSDNMKAPGNYIAIIEFKDQCEDCMRRSRIVVSYTPSNTRLMLDKAMSEGSRRIDQSIHVHNLLGPVFITTLNNFYIFGHLAAG